jgi:hypothetical protein
MPHEFNDELAEMVGDVIREVLGPLVSRLKAAEATAAEVKAHGVEEVKTTRDALLTLVAKVAAVEARPPVPGPPGPSGTDGKDGLGLEELEAAVTGRELTLTFTNGTRTKTIAVELTGLPVYQGVYAETKTYVIGDLVTSDRSVWTCQQPIRDRKPGTSPHWKLFVSRDRG